MKTVKRSIATILSVIMVVMILPFSTVSAKEYNVDEQFTKLQSNVDKVLKETGEKYIYNEEEVKKAIKKN